MSPDEMVEGLRYMWHGAISKDRRVIEAAARYISATKIGDFKDYMTLAVVGDGIHVRTQDIGPLVVAPGDGINLTVGGVKFHVNVEER